MTCQQMQIFLLMRSRLKSPFEAANGCKRVLESMKGNAGPRVPSIGFEQRPCIVTDIGACKSWGYLLSFGVGMCIQDGISSCIIWLPSGRNNGGDRRKHQLALSRLHSQWIV